MITLATLPQASAQEVFDQAALHLLIQNEICTIEGGTNCMYKNAKGQACAAGCFIAPKEYKPEWENKTWDALANNNDVPLDHCGLIRKLQRAHDRNVVDLWKSQLLAIADEFSLSTKVVDEFVR